MDIELDLKTREQVARMHILENNFKTAQSVQHSKDIELELGKCYQWLMSNSEFTKDIS